MMIPQDEAELAECIADASAPINIQGGGTRGFASTGETLSTRGLRGVELYEPGSLTLVAKAGTPMVELEELLAAEGQRLAFEPMDSRNLLGIAGEPTIGGTIAANISGPRRIQGGAARDYLLGVRFADGRGQIIKNGGRVMKNVTGYDLVKLMAGSYGTLGVLSEVSLKVLPQPEAAGTVCVAVPDLATAVASMSSALGTPYDVTGAAYDPAGGLVHIRVEGFASSVKYRCGKLAAELARFGPVDQHHGTQDLRPDFGQDTGQDLWSGIRDVAAFHDVPGDVWRISVKPSDAVILAPELAASALQFDWGGGLIWALAEEGSDLRVKLRQAGVAGHATLVRAQAETQAALGRFQPQVAPLEQISKGLRQKFDPRGLLNSGLMG